jgi:hypothetical protein
MNFVTSPDVFQSHLGIINTLFWPQKRLPEQVFKERIARPVFLDSDGILSSSSFEKLKLFMAATSEQNFYLAVTHPDPEKHFYERSGKFPILEISPRDQPEEYLQLLYEDLGEAGAISYNGRVIVFFSDSATWGINVDQDLELAVAGFADDHTKSVFTSVYGPDELFNASEAIDQLLYAPFIHNPEGVPKDIRDQLVRNYE